MGDREMLVGRVGLALREIVVCIGCECDIGRADAQLKIVEAIPSSSLVNSQFISLSRWVALIE